MKNKTEKFLNISKGFDLDKKRAKSERK